MFIAKKIYIVLNPKNSNKPYHIDLRSDNSSRKKK